VHFNLERSALCIEAEKQGADITADSYDKNTKSRAFKGLRLKDAA
jgi:hypothetical protein